MHKAFTKWLVIAVVVVALDQLAKFVITRSFTLHESLEITSFFNLVLVYNQGAAFSFLSDAGGWQRIFFTMIALVASVWITWLLSRHAAQTLFCLALSLILGGAVGNVIDRIVIGAVVDFFDFHAYGVHWPAFNVADAAISCGAALLIWDAFKTQKPATA
ncbi:MAG: signal peptidase II [Pseudomonadota bacterium]